MSRELRIKTEELPLRPRGLAPEEISRVFGGCINLGLATMGSQGNLCDSTSDCCEGLTCTRVWRPFGSNSLFDIATCQ